MNCIRCRAPLKSVTDGEAKVPSESCICCRGLWFNKKNAIIALGVSSIGKTTDQDKLDQNCPNCAGTALSHFRFEDGQMPIIACPKCLGVWIDGGQFLKLKTIVQAASRRFKNSSANENFNLAMGIPKNRPRPKKETPWLIIASLVFVGSGIGIVVMYFLKK